MVAVAGASIGGAPTAVDAIWQRCSGCQFQIDHHPDDYRIEIIERR